MRLIKIYVGYFFLLILIVSGFFLRPESAFASHSWGEYHWARTANPFSLKIGDNLSTGWKPYLGKTITDWSLSSVVDMATVSGATTSRKCRPTNGRDEVCNYTFGKNGWLGIAQIWVSGNHITQGIIKVNDTYFNTTAYNTPAWRNLVMCQEVGHTIGLDHQDENFDNVPLGTCMDYTRDPSASQQPNQHDYDQLELIYLHLDTFATPRSSRNRLPAALSSRDYEDKSEWGNKERDNGRIARFRRDFDGGHRLFTFIVWAKE